MMASLTWTKFWASWILNEVWEDISGTLRFVASGAAEGSCWGGHLCRSKVGFGILQKSFIQPFHHQECCKGEQEDRAGRRLPVCPTNCSWRIQLWWVLSLCPCIRLQCKNYVPVLDCNAKIRFFLSGVYILHTQMFCHFKETHWNFQGQAKTTVTSWYGRTQIPQTNNVNRQTEAKFFWTEFQLGLNISKQCESAKWGGFNKGTIASSYCFERS